MDRSELAAAAPGRVEPRHGGYPQLDGIRAVAVLAVLLYHFGVGDMRGGFLGVDVFFVLSGYLITGQLVTRWVIGGQVSLGAFWTARARRLLPALGAMLAGTATAVIVFDRSQLGLFRGDVTAAATYSSNWWYIFHERSYFAAAGRPPVLQHLWSLAVEEQFYLVWPLIVLTVLVLCKAAETRLRALTVIALLIALGSSVLMGLGSALSHAPQAGDPSRWYFGSDSHVMGLLIGAGLALVRRGDGLGASRVSPKVPARSRDTIAGFGALTLLLVMLSRADEFSVWLYRWGFVAGSLLTVVVIAVATRPGPLATVLDRPILRGLGRRSYALYLWHWPVACFTRPGPDLPVSNGGALALRLGLTFLLAEVSYQWIEQPVRRHGWRRVWRLVAGSRVGSFRAPTIIAVFASALVAGLILPATAAPARPHYSSGGTVYVSEPGRPGSAHVRVPDESGPTRAVTRHPGARTTTPAHIPVPPHRTRASATPPQHPRPAPGRAADLRHYDLVVYGDSVPLGAIPDLAATFRTVTNNAAVGAQAWTLLPELTADAKSTRLDGDVVLIHTGDNGVISRTQLASALGALSRAARVVLAVPYVPRSWQDDNRATVDSLAGHYRNLVLMDWDSAVHEHAGFLWSDGVHLTSTGEHAYATLVAAASVGN
jgi:peptidoglycan/LPS O-acetylase OafA/YrhL